MYISTKPKGIFSFQKPFINSCTYVKQVTNTALNREFRTQMNTKNGKSSPVQVQTQSFIRNILTVCICVESFSQAE